MENGEQPQPQSQAFQIVITFDPINQNLNINAPLQQPALCVQMLGMALQVLAQNMHAEQSKDKSQIIIPDFRPDLKLK